MKKLGIILFIGIIFHVTALSQNKTDKQFTKFKKCVVAGKKEKAQKFINKGFDINARDISGKTILLYCLQQNNEYFARFFIENGADINIADYSGNTTLHYAIENCKSSNIIYQLINSGVDISEANDEMYTPFHYSALFACNEIPFYLMEKGADIFQETTFDENALHLSIESGCDTLTYYLIDNGIDIHKVDQNGYSPFFKAVYYDNLPVASLLALKNADVSIKNKDGYSAMYYAIRNNNNEMVKLLIDNNFEIESSNKKNLYMNMAAEKENKEILTYLLQYGFENPSLCNENDDCYKTAFIYHVNAEIAPDEEKLNLYQSSLNIYSIAKEKYKKELNKIRAENTAKFCGEVCLVSASAAGGYYYVPTDTMFDYSEDRKSYIKMKIEKCDAAILNIQSIISCIEANQGQDFSNCY